VNWLANLRGQDLMHTPFHLCFGLLDKAGHLRFIGGGEALRKAGYDVLEWSDLADFFSPLKGKKIGCDPASLPVAMCQLLTKAGCDLVERPEPVLAIKAIKHATEIEGFKQAHLLDGLALCRFWHWLENIPLDGQMHEADLAQELTAIRAKEPAYLCNSFATISGFQENGAIVHYRAVKGMDSPMEGSGILLVDSGAHYQMGTTDITRTFFIGSPDETPSPEAIKQSSIVLAGHIELARARFPMGTTGAQLDVICRAPLWAEGLDFGHGTGHGVGHILSMHEGPVSISKRCLLAIEAGMILSNEPGFYVEGKYGIRHENLVLATQMPGNFLGFETLSCFPFDKRLIDLNSLTSGQTDWLNSYHHWVNCQLIPHLDAQMRGWLAEKCAPL